MLRDSEGETVRSITIFFFLSSSRIQRQEMFYFSDIQRVKEQFESIR